jgi:hypothetical protein
MINFEWRKLSRLVPVKPVPKVTIEENWAASRDVLPHGVVHPPRVEKKRRPTFLIPWSGLREPEYSIRKMA